MHTILLVVVFFVSLGIGVPIGMAMLVTSLTMLLFVMDLPVMMLPQVMVNGLTGFELLAVPLFILAAEIMSVGGLTDRIMRASLVIAGRITGGLAQVSIVATVIFSGISGSALADAAGLGRIQIQTMKSGGYDVKFASAVVLASCIIAPLNPLSIIGVIYAIQAHVSVGRMLMAGVVPALLVALSLMIHVWVMVKTGRVTCPPVAAPGAREGTQIIVGALPALLAPVIIFAGLVGGIFTVTETGVAACAYSLLAAVIFYRELTWANFFARVPARGGDNRLRHADDRDRHGDVVSDHDRSGSVADRRLVPANRHGAGIKLLVFNVLLLLIGAVIEGIPALLILIPILLPVAIGLGVDPIQFGVIMNFNLCIGLIHPPMGLALFVVSNISGLSTETLAWAVLPFLVPLLLALMLFTYVPGISLWLPNLLFH